MASSNVSVINIDLRLKTILFVSTLSVDLSGIGLELKNAPVSFAIRGG
jgi:hypothetical protein